MTSPDLPAGPPPRLTGLAHGGGCGCKLAPGVLAEIMAAMPRAGPFADLMVGTESSDDAAVWRLNADQALVATTDFFTPIVDDPSTFGRIAATNALSDIYAMGARPIFALAIVGMPVARMALEDVRQILAGGAGVCAEAGVPVAGGHSIDTAEPIYGLAAIGLAHPSRIRRNRDARPGDRLVLTKALGVGVFSAALKAGALPEADYRTLVSTTTRLNSIGADLAELDEVHAMTDVTGFGLLGHLLEVCRGSGLAAEIDWAATPLLPGAWALREAGAVTGASGRNWASYGAAVDLAPSLGAAERDLLCDPQTSGGLLLSVAPQGVADVLARLEAAGFHGAAQIGRLERGEPGVRVR